MKKDSRSIYVGCCGAYCRTCRAYAEKTCKGCRMGYGTGERDITKARCAMKRCCIGIKKEEICGKCPEYSACKIIREFYAKKGYKYKRYLKSTEYIRKCGYERFAKAAKDWKEAYGKLE